jgi:hypothetical protein
MINITAVTGAIVAAALVVAGPLYVLGEYNEEALERARARVRAWKKKRSGRPNLARAGLGVGLALAIEKRNRPSYGQRVMGIRRVEAANGGPVTPTSAIVRYVSSALITALVPNESSSAREQRQERFGVLAPDLVALWHKPPGTPVAVRREALALLREHKANPFTPTIRTVGIQLVIHLLPIAMFPKRQSLPDIAAGIVTATTDK